jgi:hypothetical protein
MCEFSHVDSKLVTIKKKDALPSHRFFNFTDGKLKSLHREFEFTKNKMKTKLPNMNGSLGFYSYNYYNNNYSNYYSYNYSYNYYNNNYSNYYSYNYSYNYYIAALCKVHDKVIIHTDKGYRSNRIEIVSFLSLKDHKDKNFLNYFNEQVNKIALKLKVKVIPYQYNEKLPSI